MQALKQQEKVQLDLSEAELQHQIKEAAVETLEERVAAAKNAQADADVGELEQELATARAGAYGAVEIKSAAKDAYDRVFDPSGDPS